MSGYPVPSRIDRYPGRVVVTWSDHTTEFSNREFRLMCPCAQCVEEMSGRPLLDPASVADDIEISQLSLVGAYAVRPVFSDGHQTGIYTFEMLRKECGCERCAGGDAGEVQ